MAWYLLIFLGTFLEGELTLVLSGFAIYNGMLWLPAVVCVSVFGGFLGDWLFFELGSRKGHVVKRRWPKMADNSLRVSKLLSRYPSLFLFILRFQIGMRMVGHFSLGMGGSVGKQRYLVLNFLASIVWALFLTILCYYFAQIMSAIFSAV